MAGKTVDITVTDVADLSDVLGEVKGPAADQWGDDARASRGAETSVEQVDLDGIAEALKVLAGGGTLLTVDASGELVEVKGPDPAQWPPA